MTTGGADHQRLVAMIEARRRQLILRWDAIAIGAGITPAQLRKFRRGASGIRNSTQEGLERMLRWEPGAFDRILAGKDPIPVGDEGPAAEAKAAPDRDDDNRSTLQLTNFGAAIFRYPSSASEEERRKILRRIEAVAEEIAKEYGTL